LSRRLYSGQIVVEIESFALLCREQRQLVQLRQRQAAALAPFVDSCTGHRLLGEACRQRVRESAGAAEILD